MRKFMIILIGIWALASIISNIGCSSVPVIVAETHDGFYTENGNFHPWYQLPDQIKEK